MTQKEEIARGENVTLEFKEAMPMDSLKYLKTVVAFANGRGWRGWRGSEINSTVGNDTLMIEYGH